MLAGAPESGTCCSSDPFTRLSQDEFVDRVVARDGRTEEMMLRTVAADLYGATAGVLQRKKYRRLELAHKVFLTGLVASALAFVAQFV